MSFQNTYKTMNDALAPSPELVEAALRRTRRPALPLRRLAAAALAAALILATPALAARTELGYAMLYTVAPAAAQFFQPVRLSCEDKGVTMEVLSVRVEGSTAQAYVALSGDPVDGTCDLFDSWNFRLPFDQTGHCERVGYDPETRTALFLCETETMDGSPIPLGGKMTFSVSCFLSGKTSAEEQTVELTLSDFAQEAETVPTGLETPWHCTGGSFSDDASWERLDSAPLLKPGPVLAEPLEGLSVTAAGYADGLFQVQLCRGDATKLDNHGWFWLEDGAGNRLESLYSAGFCKEADGEGQRLDCDQFAFEVPPEELENWTLHGSFFSSATLTEGRWRVTFPLEATGGDLTALAEGHHAGSFDLQDTLLTFASALERESGWKILWEDGFHYRLFEGSASALAEFTCPSGETLRISLDLVPYEETTGLWQVGSYSWSDAPAP